MSITKESKEWTQTLALVPERWKSKHVVMVNDQPEWCRLHGESGIHANSIPDISPDLLYAILEAGIEKVGVGFVAEIQAKLSRSPTPSSALPLAWVLRWLSNVIKSPNVTDFREEANGGRNP